MKSSVENILLFVKNSIHNTIREFVGSEVSILKSLGGFPMEIKSKNKFAHNILLSYFYSIKVAILIRNPPIIARLLSLFLHITDKLYIPQIFKNFQVYVVVVLKVLFLIFNSS